MSTDNQTTTTAAKQAPKRAAKYRGTPRWTSLGDKGEKTESLSTLRAELTKLEPTKPSGGA